MACREVAVPCEGSGTTDDGHPWSTGMAHPEASPDASAHISSA